MKFGLGMLMSFVIKSYQKFLLSINNVAMTGSHFEHFAIKNEIDFEGKGISTIAPNLPQLSHMSKINISVVGGA